MFIKYHHHSLIRKLSRFRGKGFLHAAYGSRYPTQIQISRTDGILVIRPVADTVFVRFAVPVIFAILHVFNHRKSGGWVDFCFNNHDHQGGQQNAGLIIKFFLFVAN